MIVFFSAKEDVRKNWQTNQVGEDFNETPVHEQGKNN